MLALQGKLLLILKIISALCLLYLGLFYLPAGASFVISMFGLDYNLSLMGTPLVIAGAVFIVVSYRQFGQGRPKLLSIGIVFGFMAHIVMLWFTPDLSALASSPDIYVKADPLKTPDKINGIMSFESIDPSLIWMGVVNLGLLVVPAIVNFRKPPPIAPIFE